MGIKRFLWRSLSAGRAIDTIRNIVEEGGIGDGLKRTIKEDFCEDNPFTSKIYQAGHFDGKIDGYEEASEEYESKLLQQADEFLNQKQIFENQRDTYEKLLDEYETEIDSLTEMVERTEEENEYLQQLLLRDRKLRKMVV